MNDEKKECPSCNTPSDIPDDAIYCGECGEKLVLAEHSYEFFKVQLYEFNFEGEKTLLSRVEDCMKKLKMRGKKNNLQYRIEITNFNVLISISFKFLKRDYYFIIILVKDITLNKQGIMMIYKWGEFYSFTTIFKKIFEQNGIFARPLTGSFSNSFGNLLQKKAHNIIFKECDRTCKCKEQDDEKCSGDHGTTRLRKLRVEHYFDTLEDIALIEFYSNNDITDLTIKTRDDKTFNDLMNMMTGILKEIFYLMFIN